MNLRTFLRYFRRHYWQTARGHYLSTMRLFERNFDWRITGRWMLYSAFIGVAGAFGALLLSTLVKAFTGLLMVDLVGYAVPLPGGEAAGGEGFDLDRALSPLRPWLLFLVPAVGGLLSGWLVFKFAPEAEGHGTDAVIKAYHRDQGRIRPRVGVVKMLASSITIGTGGSAGQEGPIAQIGAAIGSYVGKRLNLNERDRRMLLIAGMAAGIGSIFRSPLGGSLFAVEVLYRQDIESEGLMPAIIAGITGYSVYSTIAGSSTVFTTPRFEFINPLELLPLILFALLCGIVGIAYTKVFYASRHRFFDKLALPPHYRPALGGLLVGAMGFFFPAVLGSSYGWLQQAIYGNLPILLMATLVVGKILATSLTIGSGGSGGVFAPSLVIGGMLGGIYGQGMHELTPQLVTQPGAYVMIGMATFFTGVANVPIAMTIMISEMTGSYTLLVPLIFSGVIAHLLARRWSLYTQQVRNYNESPAHRLELTPDLLANIKVGRIIDHPVYFHTLDRSHTLEEIVSVFTRTREVVLPVVEEQADTTAAAPAYCGLVLLDDIQPLLSLEDIERTLVVAADVLVPFVSVALDDTLDGVLAKFEEVGYPELPVLDSGGKIVGFVRQGQVVSEYHRAYLRRRREQAGESPLTQSSGFGPGLPI